MSCRELRGLYRSGGDLLSRVLGRSTIGAAALNGRVRDGIGCFARARATKPAKRTGDERDLGRSASPRARDCLSVSLATFTGHVHWPFHWTSLVRVDDLGVRGRGTGPPASGSDQAFRAISTGQLNALLRLHLRPIDVVVFHGPQGRPGFEGGFPLRCLQRLSCPHIATLHCRWHDNRSTSGAFTPVLSY